ncbi:MAG: DUF1289 domain-containing protein [Planktomarina sp.]
MSQDIWKRNEIQSPCVQICMIHPDVKICVGCYRTAQEITDWSRLSNADRAALMEGLPNRAALVRKRRGGRGRTG